MPNHVGLISEAPSGVKARSRAGWRRWRALSGLQNRFTIGLISEAPSGVKCTLGLKGNIYFIYIHHSVFLSAQVSSMHHHI